MAINYPEDYRYTPTHEWGQRLDTKLLKVGITPHALEHLGKVIDLKLPEVGETFAAEETCGQLFGTHHNTSIRMPLSGRIFSQNAQAMENLDLINEDPFGDGWLFIIELDYPENFDITLFSLKEYLMTLDI